jgi:hypothetical protein
MENISRDTVAQAIADHIMSQLDAIDVRDQRTGVRPTTLLTDEMIILSFMQLADTLGLYDEVLSRVDIPQHLKDRYRGTGEQQQPS